MAVQPQRVSSRSKQQATEAGVELIEICSTITEDGRLLDYELAALREWRDRHRHVDLPARGYLSEKIGRVITVGAISDADRIELQVAIEKVLPPEARHTPKSVLRVPNADDPDLPLDRYEFLVADALRDDRVTVIARYAFNGDEVVLVRDPENPHSRNAILVRLVSGYDIGHVPEADARTLAPLLDKGLPYRANIRTILTGGLSPVPVIVAEVFPEGAPVLDVRRSGEVRGPPLALGIKTPHRVAPKPATNYTGLVLLCAAVLLVILALGLL